MKCDVVIYNVQNYRQTKVVYFSLTEPSSPFNPYLVALKQETLISQMNIAIYAPPKTKKNKKKKLGEKK